jgi:hypothetical protein
MQRRKSVATVEQQIGLVRMMASGEILSGVLGPGERLALKTVLEQLDGVGPERKSERYWWVNPYYSGAQLQVKACAVLKEGRPGDREEEVYRELEAHGWVKVMPALGVR